MKRRIVVFAFLFAMMVSVCPGGTLTAFAATGEESISPCADDIEWKYKTEDGKLYKRLYNYTTGSWVGDWIYVRDL